MALRRLGVALTTLALTLAVLVPLLRSDPARPAARDTASPAAAFAKLPLSFAPERGGYMAGVDGLRMSLSSRGAVLESQKGALRMGFVGARTSKPKAEKRLPGILNVFRGPKRDWRRNIPTYERVRYAGLYPGIDAVFHGSRSQLEYDFIVAPHADPAPIALDLHGADSVNATAAGELLVRTGRTVLRQERPVAYQNIAGRRVPVEADFRVAGTRVRFDLGSYDRSKPLVIDPTLSYSSYLGGAGGDKLNSLARGPDGTIYVTGFTTSNNFPAPSGSLGTSDDSDVIVSKLNASGSALVFSNLYSGTIDDSTTTQSEDEAFDIAVDGFGNAYVVGSTGSTDFPEIVAYAKDRLGGKTATCNMAGREGFLLMTDASGTKNFSSCFGGGGDEWAYGVAVTNPGGALARVAIVGETDSNSSWGSPSLGSGADDTPAGGDSFMLTVNVANAGSCDNPPPGTAFDSDAVNPCYTVRYRTFIGASEGRGIAYDSTGNVVLTGFSFSAFPKTDGVTPPFNNNVYIAKIDPNVTGVDSLKFARAYGTDGWEKGFAIALDSSNNAYVAGELEPADDTLMPNAETTGHFVRGGGKDGLLMKFDPSGALVRTTYVGGPGNDSLDDVAIQENAGVVAQYVVGTATHLLPTHNPIVGQSCNDDNQDTQIMVAKRIDGASPVGEVLSCLGGAPPSPGSILADDEGTGIAVSPDPVDGTILVGGWTSGTNWPKTSNAFQGTYGGGNPSDQDGIVAKLTPVGIDQITAHPVALLGNVAAAFAFTTTEPDTGFACNAPDGTGHLVAGGARTKAACGTTAGQASYSGLADGTHTFAVSTADSINSQSTPSTWQFEVDATPPAPFELQTPADNAGVTSTRPVLTWTVTTDPHDVHYDLILDGNRVEFQDAPICSGGTCSARPDPPSADGLHTWKIVAKDTAEPPNARESATRTFAVGDPVSARFSIAPNPVLVGRTATFNGSASNDATHTVDKFEWDLDGDGSFELDTGSTPTATKSYATPGVVSVSMRVTDSRGLTAQSTQELQITAPSIVGDQLGVSINKGAQYTNDPNVTLSIVAPANATSLLISNDGGFVGALPQAVAQSVKWKLDSSGPERLPKTVYLRFLVNTFASSNYTDDIILDERPPIVDSASVAGNAAAAQASASKKYKIKVKARDSNSGVAGVQIAIKKSKPGKLLKYKKVVSVKLPSRPKFLRAKDRAGNYSRWKKLR